MRISRHAQVRGQQRGVPVQAIELALSEGEVRATWGRGFIYRLSDRRLRALGAGFDRLRGVEVVEVDGTVVTVWKNSNRRRVGRGRRLREAVSLREADDARKRYAA
jgi:hypothetical protein